MNELVKLLLQNKGEKSYRTLLLVAVVYACVKIHEVERRVAYIEMYVRPGKVMAIK